MSLGKETEIQALGKTWRVGRMTLGIIEAWFDWVASRVGDPYAVAKSMIKDLSREDATELLKQAKKTKQQLDSLDLNGEIAEMFLSTPSGVTRMFMLLLKQHHPEMDADTAFAILGELDPSKTAEALKRAAGKTPEKNEQPPAA